MKTAHVSLTPDQVAHLMELTSVGPVAVKTYRRAQALLALHQGLSYAAVATPQRVRYATVWQGGQPFTARGLAMLSDQPRSGRPLQSTGQERAKLTALSCSTAPDGHSQWSLRLLAGKAVELGYCRQLSAASAHGILKKTRSSPS